MHDASSKSRLHTSLSCSSFFSEQFWFAFNSFAADVEFSRHVVLEFPVRMSSFLDIVNNPKEPFGISIYRGITTVKYPPELLALLFLTFIERMETVSYCSLLFSRQRIFDMLNSSVIATPL